MSERFDKLSYKIHKNHYSKNFDKKRLNSWKEKDTIDYWRHERMYKNLDPLIFSYPNASWLTIGDGRYGSDANYLLNNGLSNVLATDISDTYLQIAQKDGFITDFKVENAESLSFKDNEFDFVLCKEAYHHFPKPMVALYEMIRVAKQAVVLIEPQDSNILIPSKFSVRTGIYWFMRALKDFVKLRLGKEPYYHFGNYENTCNYVFTISEREIEKVALGLNLKMLAFKGLNDYYSEGVEFEKITDSSKKFKEIKKQIKLNDRKVILGKRNYGVLVTIVCKTNLSSKCIDLIEEFGFKKVKLPENPYI